MCVQPLVVSILSERRAFQPYGMEGGAPGARGLNLLWTGGGGSGSASRRMISLGGKNTVEVFPGDRLTVFSPGGGAWGVAGPPAAAESDASAESGKAADAVPVRSSGSLLQYTLDQESV